MSSKRAPGRIAWRVVVTVGPVADSRVVTLPMLAREAPPPPPIRRTSAFAIGLGVGAVAAAMVGTVSGVHAIAQRRASDHLCCNLESVEYNDRAKTWADISTVAFVISGVAAAAAVISALVVSGESHR